jgi:uncharacterized membrane-anchored protein YhcB (DUF1043 family)
MDTNEQLADMLGEHSGWQKSILAYRTELEGFNQHLEEYVKRVPPREISPSVEHFQNQFIRQNEVLDIMRHDFKQFENHVEEAQNGSAPTLEELSSEKKKCQERLADFDKIFADLKKEFSEFETEELLQS